MVIEYSGKKAHKAEIVKKVVQLREAPGHDSYCRRITEDMIADLIEYVELRRRRHWSAERILMRRERLLRQLVRHACRHVAFYRRWFDRAGVNPGDIRRIADLERVPVVRKRELLASDPKSRVSTRAVLDKCVRVRTSGSMGLPLTIFYSRAEKHRRASVFQCACCDQGSGFFDRRLNVGVLRPDDSGILSRLAYAPNWLNRACGLEDGIASARSFKPDVIHGLVSQLYVFALRVRRAGIRDIRPRLLIVYGEMLGPQTRALLEDTFCAPVRTRYASWEFGVIATDCPAGSGYHLSTDDLLVECLKDGRPAGPGESGEIVITGLTSRVMPFIRFSLGDIAALKPGPCACGHSGPRLVDLQGRCDDLIVRPDGVVLSAFQANKPLIKQDAIRQFRITQEAPDAFRIEYEAPAPLEDGAERGIREYFEREFLATQVDVRRVHRLPLDSSGKIRKFVSKLEDSRSAPA